MHMRYMLSINDLKMLCIDILTLYVCKNNSAEYSAGHVFR